MKAVSEMTFEETISICLEALSSFSQSCKETHDASGCNLEPCIVKCLCGELFSYVLDKKTPHLEKVFFTRYL